MSNDIMVQQTQGGFCIPYEIRHTAEKGNGVYATADIDKGTLIWRHLARHFEVYDERKLKQLLEQSTHEQAVYLLTHIFGLPEFPGYMINVLDNGVLINHSQQSNLIMNQNAEADPLPAIHSAEGVAIALLNDRFALFAGWDIGVGDELTHNYDQDVEDPAYYDALCEQYEVSWDWL
jgi:SET domain-containing protein